TDDQQISAPYSKEDLGGKAKCKASLQRRMGLPERESVPLIGVPGPVETDDGVSTVRRVVETLPSEAQLVIGGSSSGPLAYSSLDGGMVGVVRTAVELDA